MWWQNSSRGTQISTTSSGAGGGIRHLSGQMEVVIPQVCLGSVASRENCKQNLAFPNYLGRLLTMQTCTDSTLPQPPSCRYHRPGVLAGACYSHLCLLPRSFCHYSEFVTACERRLSDELFSFKALLLLPSDAKPGRQYPYNWSITLHFIWTSSLVATFSARPLKLMHHIKNMAFNQFRINTPAVMSWMSSITVYNLFTPPAILEKNKCAGRLSLGAYSPPVRWIALLVAISSTGEGQAGLVK